MILFYLYSADIGLDFYSCVPRGRLVRNIAIPKPVFQPVKTLFVILLYAVVRKGGGRLVFPSCHCYALLAKQVALWVLVMSSTRWTQRYS